MNSVFVCPEDGNIIYLLPETLIEWGRMIKMGCVCGQWNLALKVLPETIQMETILLLLLLLLRLTFNAFVDNNLVVTLVRKETALNPKFPVDQTVALLANKRVNGWKVFCLQLDFVGPSTSSSSSSSSPKGPLCEWIQFIEAINLWHFSSANWIVGPTKILTLNKGFIFPLLIS